MGKFATRLALAVGAMACTSAALAEQGFVQIRDEGEIVDLWQPAGGLPRPQYPPALAGHSEDVCINLGYLVDREGRTSNYVLLKSWGQHGAQDRTGRERMALFAQSAAHALQQWRFEPNVAQDGRRRPMYTSATFAFSRNPDANRQALRARCSVGDLRDYIDRAFAKGQKSGILRGEMERQALVTLDNRHLHLPIARPPRPEQFER